VRLTEPVSGYSTQARLSLEVASLINNGRIRFWFATEFNPIHNESGCNPLRIFDQLDRAAKKGDEGSAKAQSVAANLRACVALWEARGLIDRDTQVQAFWLIRTASDASGFRPAVFFLNGVVGAEKGGQPDEYWVGNEPIGGERSHQILPPQDLDRDR
jgi:hypothetical protein